MSDLNIRVLYDPHYRIITLSTRRGFTQLRDQEKWQADGLAHLFGVTTEVQGG